MLSYNCRIPAFLFAVPAGAVDSGFTVLAIVHQLTINSLGKSAY
jgi:hypothetical protein